MKKILLFLALVLPLSLYSIDLFHNKGGDLKTLRDKQTHIVYFVPINESYDDPKDWHHVRVEYHPENGANPWRCWDTSKSDVRNAHALFDEIGANVGEIGEKLFMAQFFFADDDFEIHLDSSSQYIGLDYDF